MNTEAIKNRSKAEAKKALESFKWNNAQRLLLGDLAKHGIINMPYTTLLRIFGLYAVGNDSKPCDCALLWGVEYSNGRKLFRKQDIGFLPLI